ncbi:MAG: hypothetical protein P3B76_11035 [Gemmatimonadota bacterium]|nr:hypothetical protein [Gemmatimonadota bacterium]
MTRAKAAPNPRRGRIMHSLPEFSHAEMLTEHSLGAVGHSARVPAPDSAGERQ